VERERFLLQRLSLHVDPPEKFIGAFLKPPLYSVAYDAGFGTLYTAVYHPRRFEMELRWPGKSWQLSGAAMIEGSQRIIYPDAARIS
jgi:hypothetical protein